MGKQRTKEQIDFDKSVEDDIAGKIAADMNEKEETKTSETPKNTEEEIDTSGEGVKNSKKTVDNNIKTTDNNNDDESDEQDMYQAVVDKVLADELDGDESRLDEAKAIANIAIKTFNGDPVKAAKSYRNLWRKTKAVQDTVQNNPFIEKLINEANQGKKVDENYVKSLLGTATSAEQPTEKQPKDNHDQLEDDFDPDNITVDQLIETGILDKQDYENSDAIDRKEMVEKAKIRYAYKVLPEKMAERQVRLSQKKVQEQAQQDKRDKAISTNKTRISNDTSKVLSKYDVDFENNPVHAQLWEEIRQKAYRIPDLEDEDGMLIADDAVERATKHVFAKHGVPLQSVEIADDETDTSKTSEHKIDRMESGSMTAMQRILGDVQGFKGVASKKQKREQSENPGNTLNDRVTQKVHENLSRGRQTSHLISNVRKADRTKPE